jgi:hypothetical protein
MGTPSLDAESVDIIIEAKFTADNKEEIISTNLRLNVAPAAARPSLTPEARALSDSAILGKSPTQISGSLPPTKVIEVLDKSIVSMANTGSVGHFIPEKDKCKHVLSQAREACTHERPEISSRAMASAVGDVVSLAYTAVCKDRSCKGGRIPTVQDVSAATNGAVVKAVKIKGTATDAIDIIHTASKVLQDNIQTFHPSSMERPFRRTNSSLSHFLPPPSGLLAQAMSYPSV